MSYNKDMLLEGEKSFKKFVSKEIEQANPSSSFEVRDYLSNLLYQYLFSETLFEKQADNGQSYERSLAEIFAKTYEADSQARIHLYKRIGDLSLYLSGFFRSSFKKRLVHVSYYEDMGQSAYAYLADCYEGRQSVFSSLSGQFKSLSEILFSIQKKSESQYQNQYHLNFDKSPSHFLDNALIKQP